MALCTFHAYHILVCLIIDKNKLPSLLQ
jgi:hypothetical protein